VEREGSERIKVKGGKAEWKGTEKWKKRKKK